MSEQRVWKYEVSWRKGCHEIMQQHDDYPYCLAFYSIFGNNFVKTMIRLGKEKNELGVIFDQIGTPTYAGDLANVIMTAINQGVKTGIYHFSNEGVISWYDFTKAIHRIAGIKTCHIKPLHTSEYPTPASRPAYSVILTKQRSKTNSMSKFLIGRILWKSASINF